MAPAKPQRRQPDQQTRQDHAVGQQLLDDVERRAAVLGTGPQAVQRVVDAARDHEGDDDHQDGRDKSAQRDPGAADVGQRQGRELLEVFHGAPI
jgi:hypothetical protein